MAQKIVVYLIDDIDGSDATETVSFAIDGNHYEIDLNDTHAAELRAGLEKWMKHGRRVVGRQARAGQPRRTAATSDASKIRQWAYEQGYEISARGRIPAEIREAYAQRKK